MSVSINKVVLEPEKKKKQITVESKQAYICMYIHRCLYVCTDVCVYIYI